MVCNSCSKHKKSCKSCQSSSSSSSCGYKCSKGCSSSSSSSCRKCGSFSSCSCNSKRHCSSSSSSSSSCSSSSSSSSSDAPVDMYIYGAGNCGGQQQLPAQMQLQVNLPFQKPQLGQGLNAQFVRNINRLANIPQQLPQFPPIRQFPQQQQQQSSQCSGSVIYTGANGANSTPLKPNQIPVIVNPTNYAVSTTVNSPCNSLFTYDPNGGFTIQSSSAKLAPGAFAWVRLTTTGPGPQNVQFLCGSLTQFVSVTGSLEAKVYLSPGQNCSTFSSGYPVFLAISNWGTSVVNASIEMAGVSLSSC